MPTKSKTKHKQLLRKKEVVRQYNNDTKTKEQAYANKDKLTSVDRNKARGWTISGASIVIIDATTNNILLRKKGSKHSLFGGNRVKAEHPHDCATRLLSEQTGGLVNVDSNLLWKESKWTNVLDKTVKCQYRCFVHEYKLDTKFDPAAFDIVCIKLIDLKAALKNTNNPLKFDDMTIEMLCICIEANLI